MIAREDAEGGWSHSKDGMEVLPLPVLLSPVDPPAPGKTVPDGHLMCFFKGSAVILKVGPLTVLFLEVIRRRRWSDAIFCSIIPGIHSLLLFQHPFFTRRGDPIDQDL